MTVDRLVSVVIPTYNRAEYVTQAIDSVLAQTYRNFEIIVVDDGSTDGTPDVMLRYDRRITYIQQSNQGPSVARNRGIAAARGEYIAFLDSDDTWHPEKLALQVGAMERFGESCGVCFTNARAVGAPNLPPSFFYRCRFSPRDDEVLFDDSLRLAFMPRQPVLLPTMMVRRTVLSEGEAFDPLMLVGEDTDLIFRLALRTRFCCVNRVLTYYDVSPDRGATTKDLTGHDPMIRLFAEARMYRRLFSELNGDRRWARREVRRRLAAVIAGQAGLFAANGEQREAQRHLREAVRVRPSVRTLVKCILGHLYQKLCVPRRDSD